MVVKAARVGGRSRAQTVIDELNGILTSRKKLRILPLVNRSAGSLVGTSCVDNTMPQVCPVLLEAIGDVSDLFIIA